MCKQLVGLMGGEIGFESQAGVGSRFWFTMRLPQVESALLPVTPAPAVSAPETKHGHVLVVEDNAVNRKVAVAFLDRLGYTAEIALDGVDALDAMKTRDYDVVLMDCQMPRMDGYEAATRIREREQGHQHTPIVAMTASAMASDRDRCLAAGMDDYLSKPLDRDLLATTLHHWMHDQSVSGAARVGSG